MGGSDVDRAFDALLGRILGRGCPGDLNLYAKASPGSILKATSRFRDVAKHAIAPESGPLVVDITHVLMSLQRSATGGGGLI